MVYKHTWPGTFGFVPVIEDGVFSVEPATQEGYRWRNHLQNRALGDEIILQGLIYLPYEKGVVDPQGEIGPALVISQPFRSGRPATPEAVSTFMEENQFRPAPHRNVWYREDGVLVADAHFGNFIDIDGRLFPIDLQLNQVPPECFQAVGWPL
ncbi:MAG: hypothetical protein PW734_01910 [Verrucomicrobium sp.]|nr:hypothetical protein [Verrucomicrobium sp.]